MMAEMEAQAEKFRVLIATHNYNPREFIKKANVYQEKAQNAGLELRKSQAFWTAWDLLYTKERLLQICKAKSESEVELALTSARHDTEYRNETISIVRDYIKGNGSRVPRKRQIDSAV